MSVGEGVLAGESLDQRSLQVLDWVENGLDWSGLLHNAITEDSLHGLLVEGLLGHREGLVDGVGDDRLLLECLLDCLGMDWLLVECLGLDGLGNGLLLVECVGLDCLDRGSLLDVGLLDGLDWVSLMDDGLLVYRESLLESVEKHLRISLGLGLGLSLPLSVEVASVVKGTVGVPGSVGLAKAISIGVGVSKASISVLTVQESRVSLGFRLGHGEARESENYEELHG